MLQSDVPACQGDSQEAVNALATAEVIERKAAEEARATVLASDDEEVVDDADVGRGGKSGQTM